MSRITTSVGGAAVPVLGTLTLSGTLTNGTTSSGTINGATTASTITSNVTGLSVNSGARTYSWDGTGAAGTTANGLVETLAGATGSPKNNSVTVGAAATAVPATGNLVFTLRAKDLVGTYADGAKVPSWTDTTSGAVGTQATTAAQPTFKSAGYNGKPTVRYAGPTTPQMLNFGRNAAVIAALDSTTFTVLTIVANASTSTYGTIVSTHTGSAGVIYAQANGTRCGTGAGVASTSIPFSASTPLVVGATTAGGVSKNGGIYANGTRFTSEPGFGNTSTRDLIVGGTSGNGAGTAFSGDVIEVRIWNKVLDAAEVLQYTKYAFEELGITAPWVTANEFIITDGDSQTAGTGSTQPDYNWPYKVTQARGRPLGTWTNTALSGTQPAAMSTRAATTVDLIPALVGVKTILIAMELYNSLLSGATGTAAYNSLVTYLQGRRTANPALKIAVMDSLDSNSTFVNTTYAGGYAGWHTQRATFNSLIAANYATFADAYINISTETHVGVDGSCVAGAYWNADLIHPAGTAATGTGYEAMANFITPAIAAL